MLFTWPWPPDEDFLRQRLKAPESRAGLLSAIERDGMVIGFVGCIGGSLFYGLAREHWGQGFASEAAAAKIARAFADPSVEQLIAGTWDDNAASARILQKLGFEQTGHDTVFHAARGEDASGPDFELTRGRWQTLH